MIQMEWGICKELVRNWDWRWQWVRKDKLRIGHYHPDRGDFLKQCHLSSKSFGNIAHMYFIFSYLYVPDSWNSSWNFPILNLSHSWQEMLRRPRYVSDTFALLLFFRTDLKWVILEQLSSYILSTNMKFDHPIKYHRHHHHPPFPTPHLTLATNSPCLAPSMFLPVM